MEDNNIIKEKVISKISVSKFKEENVVIKKKKNYKYMKYGMVACICLTFLTGIVFANEIESYIKKIFNNSTKSIDVAVENGYIQEEDSDYIYDKDIGIKVDNLILDDLNLDISFNFETKKENVKSIRLRDFIITNDNEKVVFQSEFKGVETLEELPIYNSVTWINEPIRLTDTTFTDSILFGLRPEKEDFKELYFDIRSLQITYLDETIEIIDGTWNFNVVINEEMRKNTAVIYNMVESNEYIENCTATMTNTGTDIKLVSKVKIPIPPATAPEKSLLYCIYLSNEDKQYKDFWLDYNEEVMDIHFRDVGNFIENSDTLELHLEFFNTTITLVKETN